jgi:hypothetical protein
MINKRDKTCVSESLIVRFSKIVFVKMEGA